jgi:hypothetical protein
VSPFATAVLGGFAGSALSIASVWLKSWYDDFQARKRDLRFVALACVDRLEKIELVRPKSPPEAVQPLPDQPASNDPAGAEVERFGSDLDRYLNAIAAARESDRRRHFDAYEHLRPILICHNYNKIPSAIDLLHAMSGTARASALAGEAARTR